MCWGRGLTLSRQIFVALGPGTSFHVPIAAIFVTSSSGSVRSFTIKAGFSLKFAGPRKDLQWKT
jgi:hypothetical protein